MDNENKMGIPYTPYRPSRILAGLLACFLFATAACGGDNDASTNAEDEGRSDAGGDEAGDGGSAETDGDVNDGMGTVEGVVYRQGEVDHSGVSVTLNGTDHDAVSHATGFYQIENVRPGTYTISVSAMGYTEETSDPFEVKAGETAAVDPITIEIAIGELAGAVLLEGQDVHSGAVITVGGTSHTAQTDENGNWSMSGVAVGQYTIEVTHSRYEPAFATDISVLAGQVTMVPAMTLTCPTGYIVDGVCCNSACDGMCESCNLGGSEGTCAAHASGTDPDTECTLGIACDSACDGTGGDGRGTCLVQSCEGNLAHHPLSMNPYADKGDGTVTDVITGLMWVRCPAGQNGPDCSTGAAGSYFWSQALNYCETLELAGYSDWRLPNRNELQTIVDYRRHSPAIDEGAFPNTPTWNFWSSSSFALDESEAWAVSFTEGEPQHIHHVGDIHARCVRLGPLNQGNFDVLTLSGDRVVTDSANGLMWQGCPLGQTGDRCLSGGAGMYEWQQAKDACDNLVYAGFDDWRLPDIAELNTVVDVNRYAPAIDSTAFLGPPLAVAFWSSTPKADSQDGFWLVNLSRGELGSARYSGALDVAPRHYARCVRLEPGASPSDS